MAAIKRSLAASTTLRASASASASSSVAFSGAGFLTSYHLGAADCLSKHGAIVAVGSNSDWSGCPTVLSGVSGGALAAASICLLIRPEDAMAATLAIAQNARTTGGVLDHLHPGFSLVDQVESALLHLTKDLDEERVLRGVRPGRLRIGLTDSGCFPFLSSRRRHEACVYVDEYESISEILAACVLSSYVPGLTGPSPLQRSHRSHPAVARAEQVVHRMRKRGAVKDRHGTVRSRMMERGGRFWDGGLTNVFPVVNRETVLVTPFAGRFKNPTIKPQTMTPYSLIPDDDGRGLSLPWSLLPANNNDRLDVYFSNARAMRYIALSSSDEALESWFMQGYDDAARFLKEKGALTQFSVPVSVEVGNIEDGASRRQQQSLAAPT